MTETTRHRDLKTFPPLSEVSRLFLRNRTTIETTWMQRCRSEIRSAKDLEKPILMNTLPAFLANIAEALTPGYPRATGTEMTTLAQEHGNERARLTDYDPNQIIREYQILGEVIFAVLGRQIRLTSMHRLIIQKSIDEAIREAVTAFALVQVELRQQLAGSLSAEITRLLHNAFMQLQPVKRLNNHEINGYITKAEHSIAEALACSSELSAKASL